MRFHRSYTAALSAGAVLTATLALGAAAAAPAQAATGGRPDVVPTTSAPANGTIMPNFSAKQTLRSAGQSPYSVTIDAIPTTATPGERLTITGHTTGFSAGNWINAWVRLPNGTQVDDGGLVAADGSFTIPVTLEYSGTNTVQVSAGTWPSEQWSSPVNITVGAPQGPIGSATGVVYHDLTGHPLVATAANTMSGYRGATFSLCPSVGGSCLHQQATVAAPGSYIGLYSPPAGSFFDSLAPNSTDFATSITYQNL